MTGWLIVNNFIDSKKFSEIYEFFIRAGKKHDVDIIMKKTGEVMFAVGEKISLPDFVLFWDKDINLAMRFEMLGVRVFNSAKAIEICDSKALTSIYLANAGVKIPKTYIAPKTFEKFGYSDIGFLELAGENTGYPMIIKETYGSFGEQVYLAESFEDAKTIVAGISGKEFIIQEFIANSRGRDLRVNVVGGEVAASMLRYSVNGDFRSNITNGGHMKEEKANSEQEVIALKACAALGLDFAGVDVLFGDNGESVICEVNSNPHFKSTYECTGVDMGEEIIKYIKNRL